MSTLADALAWTVDALRDAGIPNPRAEAEWLLADLRCVSRSELPLHVHQVLTPTQQQRLQTAVGQRLKRVPLQQVLGQTEFFSFPFKITPHVLIPRPETEILVETLVNRLKGHSAPRILDIGTGSGAVAVALAHTLPGSRIVATDLSADALQTARENVRLNCVADRVAFLQGDLLSPFCSRPVFHALASNPPYIPSADLAHLQPEVRDFEPHLALDGGPDGLRFYRPLISQAGACLLRGGWLALEVADGQAPRVAALLSRCSEFRQIETVRDLGGIERVLLARKRR